MSVPLVVVAATIVYFGLGAAWFGPLFGRAWDRSVGHERARAGSRFPVSYYVLPLLGAIVITTVVVGLTRVIPETGVVTGLLMGAGVGLAAAAVSVINALTPHTPRPYLFAAVTGSYHLVGCVAAGLIGGLLR